MFEKPFNGILSQQKPVETIQDTQNQWMTNILNQKV